MRIYVLKALFHVFAHNAHSMLHRFRENLGLVTRVPEMLRI